MKTYTHNLYLIERTKLLEGILCQSLTFTNPLGQVYTNNPVSALLGISSRNINDEKLTELYNLVNGIYKTPILKYSNLEVLSGNNRCILSCCSPWLTACRC